MNKSIVKDDKVKKMNYILGKEENNSIFTRFELQAMSMINLDNDEVVEICKIIWRNKENDKKLQQIQNMFK
ncbi:MAG: hypothetical protein HFJ27_04980 [Clostridia bacterium]|nr:hypothetical protein [Clostridia bacterium]